MDDNSWLSETTKTVIVSIVMFILVGGALFGYYKAHTWRVERAEQNQIIEETNEQRREEPSDH
jgi:hypothetical protein